MRRTHRTRMLPALMGILPCDGSHGVSLQHANNLLATIHRWMSIAKLNFPKAYSTSFVPSSGKVISQVLDVDFCDTPCLYFREPCNVLSIGCSFDVRVSTS